MKYPLFQQILPSCFSAALKPRLNGRNSVGPNNSQLCWMLLRPFAHPFICCCVLLEDVAQTFEPTNTNISFLRDHDRVDSFAQLFLHCVGQASLLSWR